MSNLWKYVKYCGYRALLGKRVWWLCSLQENAEWSVREPPSSTPKHFLTRWEGSSFRQRGQCDGLFQMSWWNDQGQNKPKHQMESSGIKVSSKLASNEALFECVEFVSLACPEGFFSLCWHFLVRVRMMRPLEVGNVKEIVKIRSRAYCQIGKLWRSSHFHCIFSLYGLFKYFKFLSRTERIASARLYGTSAGMLCRRAFGTQLSKMFQSDDQGRREEWENLVWPDGCR